jgi:hypothetical protein
MPIALGFSLRAEPRGVVQQKDRPIARNHPFAGQLDMTGQNIRRADPIVGAKR